MFWKFVQLFIFSVLLYFKSLKYDFNTYTVHKYFPDQYESRISQCWATSLT